MTAIDLKLGTPANLLFGVKPTWTGTAESLFAPPESPTNPVDTEVDESDSEWGLPILTLHESAESLLSALYEYDVRPASGEKGTFDVGAGVLALGDSDSDAARKAAGTYLGLELDASYSYMLVRLRRSIGTATHASIAQFGAVNRDDYLTSAALDAYEALPEGKPVTDDGKQLDMLLTAEQASSYVDTLYDFGTHFVSGIEAGDVIFQVFAYDADQFAALKQAFAADADGKGEVTGITALDYQYYTTPFDKDSGYGYTAAAGRIGSFSGDPALERTIKDGAWQDSRYAGGPSVFQAWTAGHNTAHFLRQFAQVTAIAIALSPLSDLVPAVFQAKVLDRLFKGALLQKHGSAVTVPFASLRDIDWHGWFPQTTSSWLSTIATPTIDVYQEVVDLSAVQLINTDVVESFRVVSCGLLLGDADTVEVPGSELVILSYVLDTTGSGTVPTLAVSADAFDGATVSVGEMYGALAITDGKRRNVLLDGFRFADGEADPHACRTRVVLAGDVVSPPAEDVLHTLVSDLQFSLVSAETLLWSRSASAPDVHQLAVGYLEWLADLVPAESEDVDLVALAMQARYLARAARELGGQAVRVPYLTFDAYKDYVASMVSVADELADTVRDYQSQIRAAKQAELTAKTAEEINANIKSTGELLTKYFGVLAQNQRDVSAYYQSIVDQKRQEYDTSVTDVTKLAASLKEQQKVVNQAVEDFKMAVAHWETEQVLKLCFTVATDVFTLGATIAVPSTEILAVKSLGETAQKIQKVFDVLAALSKLEEDVEQSVRSLRGAENALQQLNGSLEMPSTLEWQEFQINMKTSLASVPGDLIQESANLTAAFDILSLRGQALADAKARQSQILMDLYFGERQKAMNDAAAKRLDALTDALNLGNTSKPDLPKIDLIGITGQVQSQLTQVLAALAKTLVLQDAAVQYTYLGQPTTIAKFDLLSLKQVMMQQQANIINALENLNPPPLPVDDPIEYRIAGVPTSALADGTVFEFTIQPSASEFWKYAMVRVDKVLLRVDGISGSDGGEYLANLTFVGNPFADRNAQRQTIEFDTIARHFGPYDYDIASGKALFGDKTGTTADDITKVTPFGTWQVSLPKTATNKGITFAGHTVDVALTFSITALLVDPPQGQLMLGAGQDSTNSGQATLANLLDNMYNDQAVLKGWDVVFNVLEEPVNDFLKKQYEEHFSGQDQTIDIGFCQGPFPFGDDWVASYTKVEVVLGGPLLQFLQNNHSFVKVHQAVKSGWTQSGSKKVSEDWDPAKDCNIDDPDIQWGDRKDIDVGDKPYVEGSVALSQVQGIVQPADPGSTTHSVVLDFKEGSFVAKNLDVHTDNAKLNLELTNWFVTHPVTYVINTVDFSDVTTLPALQPSKFLLNVLTTNSPDGGTTPGKNILQQFITTNGTQQSNLTINVNQPIPDGYDCSLMINTKIMFHDIFVQSFNQGSTNIVVEAVDPGKDFEAWSAQVKSGTVNGSVDFPNSGDTQYRISSSGNTVVWDISGLQFLRTQQLAIQLAYSTTKTQHFEARQESCTQYGCYWGSWGGHDVDVNVVMSGNYPITIKNSGEYAGKNQTIQLQSTPPDVDVSNTSLKPTGACECNDHDLQIAVKNELAKDVPGALQAQMASIAFSPISVFALQNLIFPGGSLITMDGAYVPGDLVVVGHLTDDTNGS